MAESCIPLCMESITRSAAVFLATSTLVRLLPEKLVPHNRKYLVLCIDATFQLPTIVFARGTGLSVHKGVRVFSLRWCPAEASPVMCTENRLLS
jgi:hypothetical protein